MEERNILLLGERGVGKSSFIESFLNFCWISNIEESFSHNLIQPELEQNRDKTNSKEITKKYYLPTEQYIYRIIDTPGIDTETNEDIIATIFKEISSLRQLHAICFFVKASLSRSNVVIDYCLKKVINELNTTAVNNFIFVFTYADVFNQSINQAQNVLQGIVEKIAEKKPSIQISVGKTNCFAIENSVFNDLKSFKIQHKIMSQNHISILKKNWSKYSEECRRLLQYINSLPPFKLFDSVTLTAIENLLENYLLSLAKSVIRNDKIQHKCKTIKLELEEAACLLQSLQRSHEETTFSENRKESRRRRGSRDNLLNQSESELDKPFSVSDVENASCSKKLNHAEMSHRSIHHSSTAKEAVSARIPLDKINKIVFTVEKQQKFIQNIDDVFQHHRSEEIVLIKQLATYSYYLNKDSRDILEKKLNQFCAKEHNTLELYKHFKKEAKTENYDVNYSIVQETIKQLEKILHQSEIFEKIFNPS